MCCASRFAGVVGELRAADPSNVQGPVKQNASPGDQSEAPRPRWKPGQEQNPGPENQDSQHMLEQPRGYVPENRKEKKSTLCEDMMQVLEEKLAQAEVEILVAI